jgi:hypothetical protein
VNFSETNEITSTTCCEVKNFMIFENLAKKASRPEYAGDPRKEIAVVFHVDSRTQARAGCVYPFRAAKSLASNGEGKRNSGITREKAMCRRIGLLACEPLRSTLNIFSEAPGSTSAVN